MSEYTEEGVTANYLYTPWPWDKLIVNGGRMADEIYEKKPGYKEDNGKTRYDLLPPELLEAVATILTYGTATRGYPERNWEAGMVWGRPFAATQRHLWAWWDGEDNDESGYSHLWHAACEIAFLIAFEAREIGEDNRPTTNFNNDCYVGEPGCSCHKEKK